MSDVYQLTVSGNLAKDAEVKQDKKGDDYLSFSFSKGAKKDGDRWVGGAWHNFSAYGQWNLDLASQLTKGKKVTVVGRPSVSAYNDKEGKAVASVFVQVGQIAFDDREAVAAGNGRQAHSRYTPSGGVEESDTTF